MTDSNLPVYGHWKVIRWETIFSDARDLLLDNFSDGKSGLSIQLIDSNNKTYTVLFPPFCCYRSINESFRNSLWRRLKENGQLNSLGNSWIAEESDFLAMLREDPVWLSQNTNAKHFVFATTEDVVEVVSPVDPEISEAS